MAVCFSFDDGHLLVVGEDAVHNGEVVFHGIGVNQSPGAVEGCVLHGGILCPEAGQCNEKERELVLICKFCVFHFRWGSVQRTRAWQKLAACYRGKNMLK